MASLEEIMAKAKAVLRRRGASVDDAHDLVQEAFVRINDYERSRSVQSREAIFVRTAINLSLDQARRQKRAPFSPSVSWTDIADSTPLPDEAMLQRARLQHLQAGIQQLNERTRRILLCKRLEGLSTQEIADQENMSCAAIEKQVARATLTLMKWMDGW
ncbi:RNA polymerase sigma-70 factor (ECF subfamily) [Sphingobium sp. OAS761]|uniref:RNA polymerase sigma factor n=1 Tax=Sphingobium sp. OAS761 TaxID=2817901 RepID=UPI00209C7F20|nr:RNA polymerase sigma-70 factor (ECF subfamily) [Sphingobium sp. OAS761]